MTSKEFIDWRVSLGLTQKKAGKALGISVASIVLYERGSRYESNELVVIPKTVSLACACLSRACLSSEAVAFSKAWREYGVNVDHKELDKIANDIDLAISGHQHI